MSALRIEYTTLGRGEVNSDFELLADIYTSEQSFALMVEYRTSERNWKQTEQLQRRYMVSSMWGRLHPAEQRLLVGELPAMFEDSYTRALERFLSVHKTEVQHDGHDNAYLFSSSYNVLTTALDGLITEELGYAVNERIKAVLDARVVWDTPEPGSGIMQWIKNLFK